MVTVTAKQVPQIVKAIGHQVDAYLTAKAFAMAWREKMSEWDKAELQRFEYKTAAEWVDKGRPERITDPDHTYLMDEEDFAEFLAARQDFVNSLNVPGLKDGYCPALVAENLLVKCEQLLVDSAAEFFEVDSHELICSGMDNYKKYIDLLVVMTLAYRGGNRNERD